MWPDRMTSSRSSKRPWGTFGALHIAFNKTPEEIASAVLPTSRCDGIEKGRKRVEVSYPVGIEG